jgi:hypothetical protein
LTGFDRMMKTGIVAIVFGTGFAPVILRVDQAVNSAGRAECRRKSPSRCKAATSKD